MASKRKQSGMNRASDDVEEPSKRAKKGFTVGPANLPDGTYRRKAKKIKDGLVRKAKVKKLYDKIKKKEPLVIPKYYSEVTSEVISAQNDQAPASMELHPARQAMLGEPEQSILQQENNRSDPSPRKRIRKPKPIPFAKEVQLAQERKEEAERKRKAIQEARQEWQRNVEERERFRKAMAKARTGGKNGQRKLGRESKVLLEKVMKRMAE